MENNIKDTMIEVRRYLLSNYNIISCINKQTISFTYNKYDVEISIADTKDTYLKGKQGLYFKYDKGYSGGGYLKEYTNDNIDEFIKKIKEKN